MAHTASKVTNSHLSRIAYLYVRQSTLRQVLTNTESATRQYALRQFGPMVPTVFAYWGVTRCQDFGEMVFNLIQVNIFGRTDTDSIEDFKGGYDFDEAFRRPFLPGAKNSTREAEPKS